MCWRASKTSPRSSGTLSYRFAVLRYYACASREKAIPTFLANLGFWIPVHVVNFRFIPPGGRVVYIGICSLLWVNFLCAVKRSGEKEG